jgi:hypothetical protein
LREAGRHDLIGEGFDCLIPSHPPKEAIERRREDANKRFRGEYVHTIPNRKPTDEASGSEAVGSRPSAGEGIEPRNPRVPNPSGAKPTGASKKKKGSKKRQRDRGPSGDSPGVGYRPGRRV